MELQGAQSSESNVEKEKNWRTHTVIICAQNKLKTLKLKLKKKQLTAFYV